MTDIKWYNPEFIPNKIPKSIALSYSYNYINEYDTIFHIENKINSLISSLKYFIKLEIPDVCIYDTDGMIIRNIILIM